MPRLRNRISIHGITIRTGTIIEVRSRTRIRLLKVVNIDQTHIQYRYNCELYMNTIGNFKDKINSAWRIINAQA